MAFTYIIDPAFLEDHLASIISYLSGYPLFSQARRNISKSNGDKAICGGCNLLLLICMYRVNLPTVLVCSTGPVK